MKPKHIRIVITETGTEIITPGIPDVPELQEYIKALKDNGIEIVTPLVNPAISLTLCG